MVSTPGGLARCAAAVLLCGLGWLGAAAQAQDDPPGRVGRVAAPQGEVWVYETEQGEWVGAAHNRPFTGGDRLATTAGASAELRVGSTTLYLGGSTELEALRLDDQRMVFRLQRGSLALRVRSREVAGELEVWHPEGRFMPLRAALYRIDRQDESSDAAVWRGDLQVEGNGLSLTLHAGQRARFWLDGPLSDTRSQWLAPLQDDFALAVQREDQADVRSAAALFVPPEMTGVEELDRHGRWQQHPEYGALWSPTVVVAGWAPYRHGQWVWLRPWGWAWVDDAPWGFAPFHYGRWLWWGNRWCWAPGPVVPRPVFAPALVGWAGAPHGPVGIGHRPLPAVAWVPLAPREPYRPGYRASPGHVNRLNPYAPHPHGPPPGYGNRAVPGAVTVLPSPTLASRQPVAAAALRADQMALQRQWQAEPFRQQAPGRAPLPPLRDTIAPRPSIALEAARSVPELAQPRPAPASPGPARATAPLADGATVPLQGAATTPPSAAVMAPRPGAATPRLPGHGSAVSLPAGSTPTLPSPAANAAHGRPAGPALLPPQERIAPSVPAPVAAGARPAAPPGLGAAVPNPAAAAPLPPVAPPTPSVGTHSRGTPPTASFRPAAPAGPVAVPAVVAPAVVTPTPVVTAKPVAPVRVEPPDAKPANDPGERRRTPDSRQKTREP